MTALLLRRTGPPRRAAALAGLIAVLGLLLTLGVSSPAFAHSVLLESTPEDGAVLDTAPETVELRFNEPVQVVEDAFRLFPGDGSPVALTARSVNSTVTVELPADIGDGAYSLAYRIVSADGHPVGGALTFQVGDGDYAAPDTSASPADPVVTETIVSVLTAAQYLGLLCLAGLLFFEHLVARAQHPARPRTRVLSRVAFGTAVVASLLLIPASGARVTGNEFVSYRGDSGDLVILPASTWMPGVSWQLLATAAVVFVLGLAAVILDARGRTVPAGVVGVLCATGALATPILVGHTQTVQPIWVMLAADLGHLLTGAFWVGGAIGLACFLIGARPVRPAPEPRVPAGTALEVVNRFSRYALISVIVLGVSGLVMGVLIIGSWTALFTSDYGRLLMVKLGIVAVVVLLAAWNRLGILPRIARQDAPAAQWRSLRRVVTWEAVLLIAVVCVTGFLTNMSPNTGPEETGGGSTAVSVSAESQGLSVDGTVTPGRSGENTLTFRLEYRGKPLTSDEITVEARLPEEQLGPFSATPTFDADTGEYRAVFALPVSGEWRIQVAARIDTYTQPIAILPVVVE